MSSSVMTLLAAALRLRKGEARPCASSSIGASIFSMRSICLSLLCACDALRGLGAEAVGEFLQARDFALLVFVGGEQLLLRCASRCTR